MTHATDILRPGPTPRPTAGLRGLASRLPAALLNGTVPRRHLILERNVPYEPAHGLCLDLYRPAKARGALPIVLFFYGGAWTDGSKDIYPFVGEAFAAEGFLVAIPTYRTYPSVRYPAFLHDCAAAVAWVHRHAGRYGGDPKRVHLVGHSAGAYNAAMLVLDRAFLQRRDLPATTVGGFVGLAGPYDFQPEDGPTLPHIFAPANRWLDTQPVSYADRGGPPTLLLVAGSDRTVLPRNSHRLAARLGKAGTSVAVKTYPHLGHVGLVTALAGLFRWRAPVLRDAVGFLRNL